VRKCAERPLVQGYEGTKARAKAISPPASARLGEALGRLVQLYDAWGQKEKAEEWRKKWEAERPRAPRTQ
jgi:hypothetical protein